MNLNIINNKKYNEESENVKLAYESLDKVLYFMNLINIKKKIF